MSDVVGVGIDLVDVDRFGATITRRPSMVTRLFTPREIRDAGGRPERLAARFAAKEACAKALGTGFSRGVFMKDMGVVNLHSGAPTLKLEGGALERLNAMTPNGHEVHIHLTLTDDHPMAMAVVVIEALLVA